MSQFRTTELDFDQIKTNLKDFFRNSSDSAYRDWDFEGSGLATLIDLLAYNTHYNAMLAHMAVNETFIDSAQLRKNVVAHAKLLGYLPHSKKAAQAYITVTFQAGSATERLELPRGSTFSTTIDGTAYTFVTLQSYSAPAVDGEYVLGSEENPVVIHQGNIKTSRYTVDENVILQKYVIDDISVDISTIRVTVKENALSTISETYVPFSNLATTDATSAVYFISENSDGKYEIYFGDGVFGKKLKTMSTVEIEFLSTVGGEANTANSFSFSGSIGPLPIPTVETIASASSGGERESIDSIRFNAPLSFSAQNRAVTADDYKAIILREFGAVDAINVWGGENQPEPEYGKVFISIKPLQALVLSDAEKDRIKLFLKTKNVLTITPVLVDPDYISIYMDVLFKYDSNRTGKTASELQSSVRSVISAFSDDELQRFDGVFRHSKLLRRVDSADLSIVNSMARVFLYKDIEIDGTVSIVSSFAASLASRVNGNYIETSAFMYNGYTAYLGDNASSVVGRRNIYIYRLDGSNKITLKSSVGYLDIASGTIYLSEFAPDSAATVRIRVKPTSLDLAPKRNQLLIIDMNETNVSGEVDSIAVAGSSGANSYITYSQDR